MAPISKTFDYIVIGGGSGGLASARRAASHGAKVALIEGSGRLGGTCVNVECVPKKIMFNAASIRLAMRDAPYYGLNFSDFKFDWSVLKKGRDAHVKKLNGIYETNVKKDNVEYISGSASFVSSNEVMVNNEVYRSDKILIATGGRPIIPKIEGAEHLIDSDQFFDLEQQPKKFAVVGSGYIGVEMASIMVKLGSDVTLFTRTDTILRKHDTMIGSVVMGEMEHAGVHFVRNSGVKAIRKNEGAAHPLAIEYTEKMGDEVKEGVESFDCILWAVGRRPNIDNLNLDKIGVNTAPSNHIIANEYQETTAPGIYSLGDVYGKVELTPVAIAAGRKLADRLFGGPQFATLKMDYDTIPTAIFSLIPVGTCGITEAQARAKYGDDNVKIYSSRFSNLYNALLEYKQPTVMKLICKLPEERVVGLHMVGRESDEILQGFGVAMKMGATKADFDSCVAIHPTAAEELVTMR